MAIRITDRDRKGVAVVAAQRLIRLDDLGAVLAALAGSTKPIGLRTTRDVVARWATLGLVEVQRSPGGGPGMVAPTSHGARWVGLPTPRPVAWTDVPHTLTTSAVMANYLRNQPSLRWQSESELRRSLPEGQHRPDGVVVLGTGERYAIEVERTPKCAERWRSIVADLLTHHTGAQYWTTEAVGRAFTAWVAANLPPEAAGRVRVFDLNAQGVAR